MQTWYYNHGNTIYGEQCTIKSNVNIVCSWLNNKKGRLFECPIEKC